MNYKITKEKSTEFSTNMFLINEYAKKISTEAVDITKKWYKQYLDTRKWYHKINDYHWFLNSLTEVDGLVLRNSCLEYPYLTRELSSVLVGMDNKKIAKLTAQNITDIIDDSNKVWNAVYFMIQYNSFMYQNYDTSIEMKRKSIPYTLDKKQYNHMKRCEEMVQALKLKD